jgi:hypothetical protein
MAEGDADDADFRSALTIEFRGGTAENGTTDLELFASSLTGWSAYLNLVANAVAFDKFTTQQPSAGPVIRVQVSRLRTGSIVADLNWLYEGPCNECDLGRC